MIELNVLKYHCINIIWYAELRCITLRLRSRKQMLENVSNIYKFRFFFHCHKGVKSIEWTEKIFNLYFTII